MTRKQIAVVISGIIILGGGLLIQKYGLAIRTAFFPAASDITKRVPDDSVPAGALDETNLPLKLPAGFSISIFAKNLAGARVMSFDQFGSMWVSRTSQGAVTLLEVGKDGNVSSQSDVFINLQKPHGLAFDPDHPGLLYIAEENKIRRVTTYSDDPGEDVMSLPSGGGHFTRTIGFGPDKKLYISIGSSCNVCNESDQERAVMMRYDPASANATAGKPATGESNVIARGLRNSVFFTWHPVTQKLWATEMGRDNLGDNTPPDEINIIEEGKTYGWPNCYGKNIHDSEFDKKVYVRNPCMEPFETPSTIDIPAHSAPLGLAFIPSNSDWPKEYWGNLLVAYHGSWNRSTPTGYKVVRHKFNEKGDYQGVEDFITGWLTPKGALGRPVDILVRPDGTLYLSDDKAGVIYKIRAPQK